MTGRCQWESDRGTGFGGTMPRLCELICAFSRSDGFPRSTSHRLRRLQDYSKRDTNQHSQPRLRTIRIPRNVIVEFPRMYARGEAQEFMFRFQSLAPGRFSQWRFRQTTLRSCSNPCGRPGMIFHSTGTPLVCRTNASRLVSATGKISSYPHEQARAGTIN
jgi:hypothetical protein